MRVLCLESSARFGLLCSKTTRVRSRYFHSSQKMMLDSPPVQPQDFIDVARELLASDKGKPRQAFLRRSVSTLYYALFHALARSCADALIGGSNADRSRSAWTQVYRSLDHGFARQQCSNSRISAFPQEIQDFANLFATMQKKRHRADYNPLERFSKSAVFADIHQTEAVIKGFKTVAIKDKRAFAAFVLLRARSD